jgi:hypothetical protein
MAEQDVTQIAQQWRTFDDARRSRLLEKMSADEKRNLRRALEPSSSAPAFTRSVTGEGVYKMAPSANGMYSDFKPISHSNVLTASDAGWRIKPEDRERFATNRRAEIMKQPDHPTGEEFRDAMRLPEAVPQKPGLWQRIESGVSKATEPTTVFPGVPTMNLHDPATGEMGLNTIKRAGRVLFGVADMGPQMWGAVKDALSSDPQRSEAGADRLDQMQLGAQVTSRLQELRSDWKRDPKLAAANVGGDVIGMWLAGKAMEVPAKGVQSLSTLRQAVAERWGPRTVKVAGQAVPIAVGEAEPLSGPGRTQTRLKESGVGARRFENLERVQQSAIKEAIRNVADETTGMVGMLKEPGVAMGDAAEATFNRARPMYAALDRALVTVPDGLRGVSEVLRAAIARAKKLGLTLEAENGDVGAIRPEADGSIQWGGSRISKATHPDRWADLVDQGIIDETGQGTPLSAYMKVRSQLLRMQRGTTDAALRYAIGDEVKAMNRNMAAALKGTRLYEDWTTANKLWSKGYALRSVADAITKSTRGSPMEAQSPALAKVPPKLQGAGLVARLNALADEGVLETAFSPTEAKNLRQAADVLDRIQRTRTGKGAGESMSPSRGVAHAVRGAVGPVVGAGAGLVAGGLHGAEIGAGLGFLVQQIGERALVNVMTRTEGVAALRAIEAARTPAQMRAAVTALKAAATAAAATGQPRPLRELKAEAEQRRAAAQ